MRVLRLLGAAALSVAMVSGCGGSRDEAAPIAETTQPTTTATERPPAPTLMGATLAGESIALGDFRGRPVLINVWSSW